MRAQAAASLPTEGYASWYGSKFAGRRTANGEIYDPSLLTAAHRSLPFDTQVRVTNMETGDSVVVRINDRGPFVRGRIIDLSRAAAARINMVGSGVARVRLELASSSPSSRWRSSANGELRGYRVISGLHERGELLLLRSPQLSQPVMVRVVSSELPEGEDSDILLSQELYNILGDSVFVLEEAAD